MKKLWKRSLTIRDNLRRRIPRMAADYFASGRVALAPGKTWDEMHRFRLETKRFRYMLELFRPAYGPALDSRIESLRQIQTLLGDINDCIVTSGMLAADPETNAVRDKLAGRAAARAEKLRRYWIARFDAPGERERWMRYLTQYVCRARPLPRSRRLPPPTADQAVTG
jgi:CHAD domain-containing protein